jgi:hypothetical protein
MKKVTQYRRMNVKTGETETFPIPQWRMADCPSGMPFSLACEVMNEYNDLSQRHLSLGVESFIYWVQK